MKTANKFCKARDFVPVGSIVKTYDFIGRPDCYVIGRVIAYGEGPFQDTLTVIPMVRVLESKVVESRTPFFHVPKPSTLEFDWSGRVEVL